jgi:putative membrane protein
MRLITHLLNVAVLLLAGCNQYHGNPRDSAPLNTKHFVVEAAEDSLEEVELAELVSRTTQNEKIRQLAKQVARDHRDTHRELVEAGRAAAQEVPTKLSPATNQELTAFIGLHPDDLDMAYVQFLIQQHREHHRELLYQVSFGEAPSVRRLAQKQLAVLLDHLTKAMVIKDNLTKGASLRTGAESSPTGSLKL